MSLPAVQTLQLRVSWSETFEGYFRKFFCLLDEYYRFISMNKVQGSPHLPNVDRKKNQNFNKEKHSPTALEVYIMTFRILFYHLP